jgi:hypothetical protein
MATQLKSDTARANGAKSHGPKTAEGREKSSRNATKHGLSGRNIVVLDCENEDDFWTVHNDQMEIHQPATPAEKDLVDQMVAARWRMRRLRSIESALLDTEMITQKAALEEKFADCDRSVELAEAYTTQANKSRAMALASRCDSRLHRMYLSSYKVLRELQADRKKQSTEPAPEPTQPETPPPPVPVEVAKPEPANPPAIRPTIPQPAQKIFDNEPKTAVIPDIPGGAGDSTAPKRGNNDSL